MVNLNEARGETPGRRDEDRKWERVQEQLMNLVTTQVTTQQTITNLSVELEDLTEHVSEVDSFLRGGKDSDRHSLETRLAMAERGVTQSEVLLRQISRQSAQLKESLDAQFKTITSDLSLLKINRAMEEKSEATKSERFKEWLRFWGPIILAGLALVVPLAKLSFDNWDKIATNFKRDTRAPIEQIQDEIKKERKKRGGAKKIKKQLEEHYGEDFDKP